MAFIDAHNIEEVILTTEGLIDDKLSEVKKIMNAIFIKEDYRVYSIYKTF